MGDEMTARLGDPNHPENRKRMEERLAEMEAELRLWKPLTPAEAEAALNEAEAAPVSAERIAEIVRKATDPAERITNSEQAQLAAQAKKLQAFKDWVHGYLDAHGVPHHPPGPHGAEGCRIGDRMDWLMAKLAELKAVIQATIARAAEWGPADKTGEGCGVCWDTAWYVVKPLTELPK
jgi:hypothetical protein